ncbi:VOC family protein [Nocardioides mangrovicus]|uniref:VOC family protein n=1 Tax=Nocardioides mangrovicus TaxID=2478913 RepID=A0A3L8P3W8_9ACTN|nr:VOC family protein [Nocardioides mangrovicus]RLV49801.1 VOC family protein [Nocardioides mangrovicus]
MAVRLEAATFEVADAEATARFWAALLDRSVVAEAGGALLPGSATQVGLRFVASEREQVGPRRLHLHLTSTSLEDQQGTVDRVLELGGRHLDVGQAPADAFVVLADPGDNELCVIEPGNRFLAGTGFLGEVTCEGSRDVGVFWRDALGWSLVWDDGGETAVQSPLGGTKVSWGGPPVAPQAGPARQRLDAVADDLAAETARLLGLGATLVRELDDRVDLADPDGTTVGLRAGS